MVVLYTLFLLEALLKRLLGCLEISLATWVRLLEMDLAKTALEHL
jgi:hypothetical protein